jgi:AraC family transcriptional regulator of adaptative response/methylated-DNA-[protein]-cysteine methyltransferase
VSGPRHQTLPTSLGLALVAQSARGLCAIALGDDADALGRDLLARFPDAVPGEVDPHLRAGVVALIERPTDPDDLPLDVRGSAFQRQVWDALRRVPAGHTTTYAELAAALGRTPGSARAVATACAANPLAIAIPCHRVLRSDGSLSGYRWGVERKRLLLQRERGWAQSPTTAGEPARLGLFDPR